MYSSKLEGLNVDDKMRGKIMKIVLREGKKVMLYF